MVDAESSDAAARSPDAKVREEWRRLEQQRIAEEIAEAREDVSDGGKVARGPHWLVWLALVLALVAGIVAAVLLNDVTGPRR